jgi:hypothetical protein
VSGNWIYVVVAALHVPGIAVMALLLRDLARSDPPDCPDAPVRLGGGPSPGWHWRPRRPARPGPRAARTAGDRQSAAV